MIGCKLLTFLQIHSCFIEFLRNIGNEFGHHFRHQRSILEFFYCAKDSLEYLSYDEFSREFFADVEINEIENQCWIIHSIKSLDNIFEGSRRIETQIFISYELHGKLKTLIEEITVNFYLTSALRDQKHDLSDYSCFCSNLIVRDFFQ